MQLYLTQLNMGNTNDKFLFRDKEVGHFLVIRPLMDKTLMDGGVERPLGLRALPELHCREYYLLRVST